jgi:glycosyltransferase involved in cell wall biosynthesis
MIYSLIEGYRIIKENNISLIHTNSWTPAIAGSLLGHLTCLPVIPTVVDVFTNNEFGGWRRWAKLNGLTTYHAAAARILEKISIAMPFEVLHTISKSTSADVLRTQPNAKIKVIYPGIETSDYIAQSHSIEYCDFILYIGRLVYYKNVDLVIKAFKDVANSVSNAKFVIVGEGPMMETWQIMASNSDLKDNILFLGSVSTAEKIRLLAKCSLLVLPSLFEGFGLVILEAFAMKKPVLVSDVRPFDEIVEDGVDGFVLPRDNPLPWSEKIKYLLLKKDVCRSMGENGQPKACDKFGLDRSIDQMEELYKQVVSDFGESGVLKTANKNSVL